MKRTKLKLLKQQILPLVSLIILAVLIWYGGPYLTISDEISLGSPLKRGYIICVFFLAWILKFIFIDLFVPETPEAVPAKEGQARKQLARLQGKFQGALAFLQKTVVDKSGKSIHLARLPWLLIIGPHHSGKTTLLANANVPFILSKKFKEGAPKVIVPSDNCDWWVTRDLVLVDIPGNFLVSKKTSGKTCPSELWRYLLGLLKKIHLSHSFKGIIVTLNLPELFKDDQWPKSEAIYDLKKRLGELLIIFGKQMPVHLVITKCDLLLGFNEFFNDCSFDEFSQAWGITIPPLNKNESLSDAFTHRFNALIKRLNKQLITHLHQERNQLARPYIKDFPLHLERLKEAVSQFIKVLMIPDLHLSSVYLTSGTQENKEEQPTFISSQSSQALQLMSAPPPPKRAYFVRQLLLHNLLATPGPITALPQKRRRWERRIVYTTSISIVMTASLLLGRDFQNSVQQAYSIQNVLSQYQLGTQKLNQDSDRLLNALPLLNALQKATNHPTDKLLLAFYSHKSQQTADVVYHKALQTIVFPEIKHYFENYLQTAENKNPDNVYGVLKAYLMLNDNEHFDAEYVLKILQQFVPVTTSKASLTELTTHIEAALSRNQVLPLDSELVLQVRKQLVSLPNSTLGFVLLKNMENNNIDSVISLGTHFGNPPVFTSNALATQIPTMFTANEFQKITTSEITIAANEVLRGNWVLGQNAVLMDQNAVHALSQELRAQYIANYVDIWESLIDNLALTSPKNLTQIAAMTKTLTGSNSPLIQVLDTIKQNTSFAPITTKSPKLQNLSILLLTASNSPSSSLYQIFVSLKDLDQYLQAIVQSSDIASSTFLVTAKRMQNGLNDPISQMQLIADQSPEPLKTWLSHLATNTWRFMLQDSGHLIQSAWKNNVMTSYRAVIVGRYPFNQKSDKEVNLQQFIQFLGQQGQLAVFYQTYLKPFVNEDKKWHWRTVDNQKLPFTDHILERLEHAARIQQAFFPNGDNKLYVPFSLQPIALEHKVKSFTLNINGQEVRFQKNKDNSERIVAWPGPNTLHATTLNFVSPFNQLASNRFDGDWGWFKLVTTATKNVRSRKEMELTFNVNGHTAKYVMFTQGHLNPFLPLNLERFSLPEKLG